MTAAKYTQNDLDYVLTYARLRGRAPSTPEEVADLIAAVRRETVEECARVCDDAGRWWGKETPPRSYEVAHSMAAAEWLAHRIRALLDEPKACSRCGATDTELYSAGVCNDALACQARSEEPKAEPLCKVCGSWERSDQHHRTYLADHHAFKPEEPGHG